MSTLLKKRMIKMIIALTILFGSIIGFNVAKQALMRRFFAHFEFPAVTVSSVKVEKRHWYPYIDAVGHFVATSGVDMSAQASGNVVAVHFKSGQYIKKDQPVIDLDDSVDQATLKYNQSDLALQKINYQRQYDLYKRGASPISTVDEANAKLQQAKANVEKTEALIAQKHIKAPFSGKLGIRQIDVGEYVSPGQTTIVSLQALDPLYLVFYLPEHLLKQLALHQNISFTVEQNPGVEFQGVITAINSKVDVNTHNILVQATVPNCPAKSLVDPLDSSLIKVKPILNSKKKLILCDSKLNTENDISNFNFIPGMFAAIKVEQPLIKDVLVLPTTAISYSLYGDSVFIIEQDKQKPKDEQGNPVLRVHRQFVTTGDQQGNMTVIKSGLNQGQLVVSAGDLKLQDGTRVVINNKIQLNNQVALTKLGE